jgi:hypothetical protein
VACQEWFSHGVCASPVFTRNLQIKVRGRAGPAPIGRAEFGPALRHRLTPSASYLNLRLLTELASCTFVGIVGTVERRTLSLITFPPPTIAPIRPDHQSVPVLRGSAGLQPVLQIVKVALAMSSSGPGEFRAGGDDAGRVKRLDGVVAALDVVEVHRLAHAGERERPLKVGAKARIVGELAQVRPEEPKSRPDRTAPA